MQDMIQKVLEHCGYDDLEPTEENLIACFLDYVDCGRFGNLTYEEAKEEVETGDITIKSIINNMLHV